MEVAELVEQLERHRGSLLSEIEKLFRRAVDDLVAAIHATKETILSDLTALDASLAALTTQVTATAASVVSRLAALEAQLAAAGLHDYSAEIASINADLGALTALDTAVTPAPPAPPTPPSPTVALDPASQLPLYTFTGTDTPDPTQWTVAVDVTASDGSALYTFSGDTVGNPPAGTSAEWEPYTGTPTAIADGVTGTVTGTP